jgi:hypothetical protein
MSKLWSVLLVAAVGCGSEIVDGAPEWDAPAPARLTVTFAPSDDELYGLMLAADAAWTLAGVHPDVITVLAPGAQQPGAVPVEWHANAEIGAMCGMPEGHTAIGCMLPGALLVSNSATGSKLTLIARHEMGHSLRELEEQWHLDCADPTDAVMCDGSRASALAQADSDFICSSASRPCD